MAEQDSPHFALDSTIMRPTLELSMIVSNGAAGLDRCLRSVAGIVDRIVIGDTGSSDETGAIARRRGAGRVEGRLR
jgi:hypothetical protein